MADDLEDKYTVAEREAIDEVFARGKEDISGGRTYGPFSTVEEMIVSMKAEMKMLPKKISDAPRPQRKR